MAWRICAAAASGAGGRSMGIGDSGQEGVRIDDHQAAGQVRILRGEIEREEAAEAVADDDGVIEFLFADVVGEAVADAIEHRGGHARHTGESGHGEHVAFEAVFVAGDGACPRPRLTTKGRGSGSWDGRGRSL